MGHGSYLLLRSVKRIEFIGSLVAALMLVTGGCATLPRNPVPTDKVFDAEVVGMPGVRAWGGILSEAFQADVLE